MLRVAEVAAVPDVPLNDSMANARSLADWKRRSTFFSRHRLRIRCSASGPCSLCCSVPVALRAKSRSSFPDVSRLKACLPVSISYSTRQN